MEYKGKNMSSVKAENRSSVLRLLNGSGSLSRKDIAAALGLTPAAVTKICAELIAEGAVRECGEERSDGHAGRRTLEFEKLKKC